MSTTLLPFNFPSEAEQLRARVERERGMTTTERIRASCDTLDAVEKLSIAGDVRDRQLAYNEECERDWQRTMKEFIALNVQ